MSASSLHLLRQLVDLAGTPDLTLDVLRSAIAETEPALRFLESHPEFPHDRKGRVRATQVNDILTRAIANLLSLRDGQVRLDEDLLYPHQASIQSLSSSS